MNEVDIYDDEEQILATKLGRRAVDAPLELQSMDPLRILHLKLSRMV